jgi:hypothetical protein
MPLFNIKEDTPLKAFLYASVVAAVSSAVLIEYRLSDPFGTFQKQKHEHGGYKLLVTNWLQTFLAACVATFVPLATFYFLFGLGGSFIALPTTA